MFTVTLGKNKSEKLVLIDDGSVNTQSEQIENLNSLAETTYSEAFVIDSVLGVVASRNLAFNPPLGRRLIVKAVDKTISAGETPNYEFVCDGFEVGDSVSELGGSVVYTVKNGDSVISDVSIAEAGSYSIEVSGLTSDKYFIVFEPGILTITETEIT